MEPRPLAYISSDERGKVNAALYEFAHHLQAQGLLLVGSIQRDTLRSGDHHCDMDVRVLPDGPEIRISQTLGPLSRGCRLDPAGLEQAVALTETRMAQGADLLLVNKFGKHEADGRGFRGAISQALLQGIPVLVGLSRLNRAAFLEFADGMAEELPLDLVAMQAWCRSVLAAA